MGQEDLTTFNGGVDDPEPVAWSFELKQTVGEDGREVHGWERRLQYDEPDSENWRQTESEYYHLRRIIPLRYSRKEHPDDARGYEFDYRNFNGNIETDISKPDPRGPNSRNLVDCTALVPLSNSE